MSCNTQTAGMIEVGSVIITALSKKQKKKQAPEKSSHCPEIIEQGSSEVRI